VFSAWHPSSAGGEFAVWQLHVSCHACDVIAADATQTERGVPARFCEPVAILARRCAWLAPRRFARVRRAAALPTAQNLLLKRNNVVVE
jgi:hypothetical protein